jgi:hypothetical protein
MTRWQIFSGSTAVARSFEEIGLDAGVGFSADGMPHLGMGVDAGDFDRDGRIDLLVANINAQTTSLHRNIGNEMFDDINLKSGLVPATPILIRRLPSRHSGPAA